MYEHDISYFKSTVREKDVLHFEDIQEVANKLNIVLQPVLLGRRLEINSAQTIGSSDSAHDVFFLQSQKSARGRLTLACKRFRREAGAFNELENKEKVESLGFKTFEHVGSGVYDVPNIGSIFVTKLLPQFVTMNHLPWRDFFVGQTDFVVKTQKPLIEISRHIAKIHSSGIIHGDLQLKNIGKTIRGDFVLFDLENSKITDKNNLDTFEYFSEVGEEIRTFCMSLVDKGFLFDSTDEVFKRSFENYFVYPYLEKLGLSNSTIIDFIDLAIKDSLEQRKFKT